MQKSDFFTPQMQNECRCRKLNGIMYVLLNVCVSMFFSFSLLLNEACFHYFCFVSHFPVWSLSHEIHGNWPLVSRQSQDSCHISVMSHFFFFLEHFSCVCLHFTVHIILHNFVHTSCWTPAGADLIFLCQIDFVVLFNL